MIIYFFKYTIFHIVCFFCQFISIIIIYTQNSCVGAHTSKRLQDWIFFCLSLSLNFCLHTIYICWRRAVVCKYFTNNFEKTRFINMKNRLEAYLCITFSMTIQLYIMNLYQTQILYQCYIMDKFISTFIPKMQDYVRLPRGWPWFDPLMMQITFSFFWAIICDEKYSRARFRSSDLWVMGPARFHCATLLVILTNHR